MDSKKRPADRGRCEHLCYPVEAMPIDGGRVARCLGCGQSGPARTSATEALAALREHGTPEVGGRRHLRVVGSA